MSLLLHYRLDEATGALGTDSSGNGFDIVNQGGVVSINDATYGNVAYFDATATSYLLLDTPPTETLGAATRTFSYWVKRYTGNLEIIHAQGATDRTGDYRIQVSGANQLQIVNNQQTLIVTEDLTAGTWYHIAQTYDGTTQNIYIDGALVGSQVKALNTSAGSFSIGGDTTYIPAFMIRADIADFRVYDDALSPVSISEMYTLGPNPPDPELVVTPYTHAADLSWDAVEGASTYRITFTQDAGTEKTITTTSALTFQVLNLRPNSSYEFKIYSNLDNVNALYSTTESTPVVDSVNIDSLLEYLENDLLLLNSTTLSEVQPFLLSSLTSGDTVQTSVGKVKFVPNAGTVPVTNNGEKLLTSFDTGGGGGQSISIVLPDATTSTISYDESSNEIVSGGINYGVGEQFALGSLKVNVKEI